ncbi:MAG: rRNA maturation RNase YbeY [Gammaproteobacteria bacterium]|nr:rRNA maturation RNase YbeY [Gammaproteobacteria bacterium]
MSVEIDVQYSENLSDSDEPPSISEFQAWANLAMREDKDVQLSIRIVDADESQALNNAYRGKNKPTNVLSFPMDIPPGMPEDLGVAMLGDLAICASVVEREAREQNKPSRDHWAHMTIHGMLHLQGYDHIEDNQAEQMESLEIDLLQQLGIANPYESTVKAQMK